jgi:hypothetical protein
MDDFEYVAGYDGVVFWFEGGYHARFEFRKTDDSRAHPHPYRYALTLHAPNGTRLMGFDNAHPVSRRGGSLRRRSPHADHWHRDAADQGRPYVFESCQKLLDDFLHEVERVLRERNVPSEVSRVETQRSA